MMAKLNDDLKFYNNIAVNRYNIYGKYIITHYINKIYEKIINKNERETMKITWA